MKAQKILILVGPTASGKSSLAVELARRLDGEVISADSRQVYRGLNIGTAKITKREMHGIPHHLIDVVSSRTAFSADDFVKHAQKAISDISARGKLPIIAGGTGFYIDALVGRITLPKVAPNPSLRIRLEKKSAQQLYAILQKKDPERAKSMATPSERNNKVRIIRALEIAAYRGRSSALQRTDLGSYECLWIGIAPDIEVLDERIAQRLQKNFKSGLIREARELHSKGLSYKRMTELGLEYRSLAQFLQGKLTRVELTQELESSIKRYARKQIIYWKRNKEIVWFTSPTAKEIQRKVKSWLG